jgi:hypothetical protein
MGSTNVILGEFRAATDGCDIDHTCSEGSGFLRGLVQKAEKRDCDKVY